MFLAGVRPEAEHKAGLIVVADQDEADFAILRIGTPFESLHPSAFFGAMQHEGRLSLRDGDASYEMVKRIASKVPTVIAIDMGRPAILTDIRDMPRAVIALFGASDEALLNVVIGRSEPRGRLPIELPATDDAVLAQRPDVSDDSERPLYPAGFGLALGSSTRGLQNNPISTRSER